ncbi:hypothetical protein FZEAL_6334 [Fusarium zealandicum]|uniref:Methyl-CpG-binding domain-containing protein 4 n=1 Tax=Fusarium zealandicum TaxID=1053134 RepID=A0A8H4UHZ2_9HYPO|nr:hypothetical protein FZEAL_6334 [Fusarium zealandicum]
MTDPARSRFGHDILCAFDVWQDAADFLTDVIESGRAPAETEQLLQKSLDAGAQDWHYLIDCAESIRRVRGYDHQSLDGQDVLEYVWRVLNGSSSPQNSEPWYATDRLIARAKELEGDPAIRPPSTSGSVDGRGQRVKSRRRRRDSDSLLRPAAKAENRLTTSHYWSDQPQEQRPQESHKWSMPTQFPLSCSQAPVSVAPQESEHGGSARAASSQSFLQARGLYSNESTQQQVMALESWSVPGVKSIGMVSPYFTSAQETKPSIKKRPPRGTISAVPFAPLTSPTFGLIQEVFAHEPFWLLIAVTFLIRTRGLQAIPVLYKFKERFSSPKDVADPANTDEIIGMIRHLGLSVHRVAMMQKYARGFLHDLPKAGKSYKVKNYDQRDFDPLAKVIQNTGEDQQQQDEDDLESWEIGHLTKGKYAIDSWRIFCRDELLGRATDWNGGGREAEFQPEWMRVRPDDKELRAYLRWMWMKEGWEWDPASGERTVLRGEMQKAVNEGRVEYDDTGGLRILDEMGAGRVE